MKSSTLLSAALLAAPVAGVLPATINYAYAEAGGSYGLYVSRPFTITVLGVKKDIRVGIRVIRNGNDGNVEKYCDPHTAPDAVAFEILDARTLETLKVEDRFPVAAAQGHQSLLGSGTSGCRQIRFDLDFAPNGQSLRLGFSWDQNGGLSFGDTGRLDVADGETFTKSR